eukprot:scaffold265839_cov14-Prasinocladus_malaysianus.AAC.1
MYPVMSKLRISSRRHLHGAFLRHTMVKEDSKLTSDSHPDSSPLPEQTQRVALMLILLDRSVMCMNRYGVASVTVAILFASSMPPRTQTSLVYMYYE